LIFLFGWYAIDLFQLSLHYCHFDAIFFAISRRHASFHFHYAIDILRFRFHFIFHAFFIFRFSFSSHSDWFSFHFFDFRFHFAIFAISLSASLISFSLDAAAMVSFRYFIRWYYFRLSCRQRHDFDWFSMPRQLRFAAIFDYWFFIIRYASLLLSFIISLMPFSPPLHDTPFRIFARLRDASFQHIAADYFADFALPRHSCSCRCQLLPILMTARHIGLSSSYICSLHYYCIDKYFSHFRYEDIHSCWRPAFSQLRLLSSL